MKQVWKFQIGPGRDSLGMPAGAKVLCVQAQRETACIWALVDPTARQEERSFRTVGTGHDFAATGHLHYIGTFQLSGGSLVFHTFEEVSASSTGDVHD